MTKQIVVKLNARVFSPLIDFCKEAQVYVGSSTSDCVAFGLYFGYAYAIIETSEDSQDSNYSSMMSSSTCRIL